jgi:hypothetical protein
VIHITAPSRNLAQGQAASSVISRSAVGGVGARGSQPGFRLPYHATTRCRGFIVGGVEGFGILLRRAAIGHPLNNSARVPEPQNNPLIRTEVSGNGTDTCERRVTVPNTAPQPVATTANMARVADTIGRNPPMRAAPDLRQNVIQRTAIRAVEFCLLALHTRVHTDPAERAQPKHRLCAETLDVAKPTFGKVVFAVIC